MATTLLLVSVVLSGLMALPVLPVSDLPDVDLPVISVSASNADGSPEVMARTVAAPLERHPGNIVGVTQMEAAIRAARCDLPTTLGSDPQYHRANPNATPVLILAVTPGVQPMAKLYDLVNTTLRPMLLMQGGRHSYGQFRPYGAGGDEPTAAFQVRHGVREPPRGSGFSQCPYAQRRDRYGRPRHYLMVRAQPGANLVGIVDAVKARLPQLRTLMPTGADISVARDGSAVFLSFRERGERDHHGVGGRSTVSSGPLVCIRCGGA